MSNLTIITGDFEYPLSTLACSAVTGMWHVRVPIHFRCENIFLSKLTIPIRCFQVKARLQKMGALSPMNIFLRQEIDRMQRVITAVRQTLTDLKLAIDGTIIMSEVCYFLSDTLYPCKLTVKSRHVVSYITFNGRFETMVEVPMVDLIIFSRGRWVLYKGPYGKAPPRRPSNPLPSCTKGTPLTYFHDRSFLLIHRQKRKPWLCHFHVVFNKLNDTAIRYVCSKYFD